MQWNSFRSIIIHLDLRSINKTPNDQQAINCKRDREEQNHTLTGYCLHHLVTPVEVGNHTSKREKEIKKNMHKLILLQCQCFL